MAIRIRKPVKTETPTLNSTPTAKPVKQIPVWAESHKEEKSVDGKVSPFASPKISSIKTAPLPLTLWAISNGVSGAIFKDEKLMKFIEDRFLNASRSRFRNLMETGEFGTVENLDVLEDDFKEQVNGLNNNI